MAIDTVVRGGTVVHDWGREEVSVGIDKETFAGLYAPDCEPPAREVVDATGCLVLPGAVDMHSHHREGTGDGFSYKEDIVTATTACAAGGITTSVAMPNVDPPPNTVSRLEALADRYRERAVVDWNINPAGTVVDEVPDLALTGIAAFKVFMVVDTGRDYPHMPGIGVHDHGKLMAIMEACAAADVPLMVHPHDQPLMDHIEQQYWARGERDALAYAKAYADHDGLIWETAIATLLRMQRATGVHLHLLHIQTAGSVAMIREAKRRGQRVSAEINPWALFLGDWEAIEKWGSYALSYYVPKQNHDPLWEGLGDGTIDILASDHAPHTREEKEIGWTDGWKAHTGTPSAQFYLPMLLTAASDGLISVERAVGATSTTAADLFRIPGKGRISPGRDADLVIVDPNATHEITDAEVLSKIGWTPYAGRTISAVPRRTIVRGTTVYADGKVVGTPGYGRLARARTSHTPPVGATSATVDAA